MPRAQFRLRHAVGPGVLVISMPLGQVRPLRPLFAEFYANTCCGGFQAWQASDAWRFSVQSVRPDLSGSVVMVLAALLRFRSGGRRHCSSRRWAIWHRWCARWILGIRTRVIGDLPAHGVLYALKHEAMFETIETLVFHRPVVVMKNSDMLAGAILRTADGRHPGRS